MTELPKPIAAAAGAGDVAVEKMRELSQKAADKLSAMESDPSAFADRVQSNIESGAGSLGTVFRSAQGTVREQAQDLSQRAQQLLTTAVEQAGETYETLARRGETVVNRDVRSLTDVPGVRMIKPVQERTDEPAADTETDEGDTAERGNESADTGASGTARTNGSTSGTTKKSTGSTTRKSTSTSKKSSTRKSTGNGGKSEG